MKSFIKIKSVYLFWLILSIISLQSFAQKSNEFRKVENNAFREGEKLTFDVKYGFVTAGIATFEIPKVKKISGRDAYHITFEVNTVGDLNSIYVKENIPEIFQLSLIRGEAKQKQAKGSMTFLFM